MERRCSGVRANLFICWLKEAEEQGAGSKGERLRTIFYSTPTRKFPLHPAPFPPASSPRPYKCISVVTHLESYKTLENTTNIFPS
jgi:hypothetical protein